jgi:TatA/E family protein of Tat protein translocase
MNVGLTEMIFLFILGLLLFGPKKLPEIGRKLGKAMAEFKRASNEFQSQLNDEVRKLEIENIELEEKPRLVVPPTGTTARGGFAGSDREIVITDSDSLSEPERQNG